MSLDPSTDDLAGAARREGAADRPSAAGYAAALGIVAGALAVALLVQPLAGTANTYLAFLTAVVGIAVRYGRGPSIAASLASVLACNFFFLPPLYTLSIADRQNTVALFFFLVVALATSNLAARARAQALAARRRTEVATALYGFSRRIAGIATMQELLAAATRQIGAATGRDVVLMLPDAAGLLQPQESAAPTVEIEEVELAALRAAWARSNAEAAPEHDLVRVGERVFFALRTAHGMVGFAGVGLSRAGEGPGAEDMKLLQAMADQTAVAVERIRLAGERDEARLAAESERLRSALLAALSHDLKTPLASITGAVTALRQYGPLYDETARDELAGTIQDEAERLSRFVANLLDMARLEAQAVVPERQPVDLGEVVDTALRRTAVVLAQHVVRIDLAPDLPMLELDPVLVEQVLVNLLDNAAKYTPPGTRVWVEARGSAEGVTLAVADNGPGLQPGDREHVFEKFYRGRLGDRRPAGTGLGLAIARGFVEALGGTIEAADRVAGRGARFSIVFPATLIASLDDKAAE